MVLSFSRMIKGLDWPLMIVTLLLLVFGLATLFSLTLSHDAIATERFQKQLLLAGIGVVLMVAVGFLDFRIFKDTAWVWYVMGIVLLGAVLVWGATLRGTTGWIELGPLSFQPVEFVKITFIIFLSKFLADSSYHLIETHRLLFFIFFVIFPVGLVLAQPDFGSAFVLMACALGYLFFIKTRKGLLLGMCGVMILMAVISWFFLFKDFQKDRILTFIDPSRDPLRSGYHVTQSVIAVGSGQIFGRGLGQGTQSQLKFLPERETDFIFAVIAEQLGFVGVVLVIGFLGFLMYRLIVIALRATDPFGGLFCLGVVLVIALHMFINIGMNIGIAPVTGLPLPLVSYGRSSLLALLIALGIAQSVATHRHNIGTVERG
ncbi:MAG: rod shape-determining protein RodA [Candidatus Jacksonbacteria bacterium RIFCSPLOWO2_02_FULL_43_9]|nr:MAG: Rod shape-determining protein RodA [Parcubacteria group bacterium GW2011_GWA2_43_13]OGY68880.1 MAG: rod shape-determining protein RodA [Candidatus Jacksonbacteria bacterium RIFCSPHIGHO2_02_FULL_43_10]OGY70299.1 MAG: rod shape-determining protein RodA [Candidatus Jacksonbacteria bacterium RIFCSPLOWO2_01_FULL_44_13]OGY73206.1 MAG: rod shape-determining protein RodA [Candidatus Jacksonbacteria bacterium RIFCSPLOWO2_02_FULL_43_9]HAZ16930.1 rod shape-determining protein RodA [Candidatus Jack